MARNLKNKFPADKTGTKYASFRNTKRIAPGKVRAASTVSKPAGGDSTPAGDQQAG